MLWSELCYSGGAWPGVLEALLQLVVGKNYDRLFSTIGAAGLGLLCYRSGQPIRWYDVTSTPVHIAPS